MSEFDEYRDWKPDDDILSETKALEMAEFLQENKMCYFTCHRDSHLDERDFIEGCCEDLARIIGGILRRKVQFEAMPMYGEKRVRYNLEGRFEEQAEPRIYKQQICDTSERLCLDHFATLEIDLRRWPHTQHGQLPGIDWPAEDIIDLYLNALREKATEGTRKKDVIISPRLTERSNTFDFDVRYA